jgi:hypothetical protein
MELLAAAETALSLVVIYSSFFIELELNKIKLNGTNNLRILNFPFFFIKYFQF